MPTPLMTAFVRLRPDMSTFKKETEAGVARANTGAAGTKEGKRFGGYFGKSAGAETEKAAKSHGARFGGLFSKVAGAGIAVGFAGDLVFKGLKKVIGDARDLGLVPLEHAVKLTGGSFEKFSGQLTPVQKRMENLGFSNADVNHSLTRLVTSTGSTGLSMKALGSAADYARFKHISLTDASVGLARAALGNTRALKDVGIATTDLPKHFSTTGTAASRLQTIMELLHKKIGGTAVDDAATFGGKMDVLKAKLTDASAQVGKALIPAISELASLAIKFLVPALKSLGTWLAASGIPLFRKITAVIIPIAGTLLRAFFVGLGAIVKVLGKLPGPVKLAAAGIIALGIAMRLAAAANPWLLLATAIITAVGLIITHWKTISKVAGQVWGHVLNVFKGIWTWIKKYWPYLLTVIAGPVGLAAALVIKHWTAIRKALVGGARAVRDFLLGIWRAIAKFTAAVWNGITAFFRRWWRGLGVVFRVAWTAIRGFLIAAWRAYGAVTRAIWNGILQFFRNWWRGLGILYHDAVTGIRDMLAGQWNRMHDTAVSVWQNLVKRIGQIWNGIKNAIRDPVNWVIKHVINGLIGAFDWVSGKVGGPNIKKFPGLAKGGRLPGYGGGDQHLRLLESGETVVDKDKSRRPEFTAWAKAVGIPGMARGGRVGQNPPHGNPHLPHGQADPGGGIGGSVRGVFRKIGDIGKITAAVFSGNTRALTNAIADMIPGGTGGAVGSLAGLLTALPAKLLTLAVKDLIGIGAASGSGAAIVQYAMRFLGKIPYVWGGTAVPGGADCSGFTQAVYKHFGIVAPRTSEAQGQWVKRGPPQSGGLAFYHSPPGGPDPGHVAIVKNAKQVISQGGGMGPDVQNIGYLPLLYTGTPPGGFGGGAHGLVPANAAAISAYLRAHGASKAASAGILGNIFQESGGNPAIGLIQILGDRGGSLASELAKTMAYINANGSMADINRHSQSATSAAVWFSDKYERPGIPQIQTRIASARASFAAGYARGGLITEPISGVGLRTGKSYSLGEAGEETVIPGRFSPGGIERRLDRLIRAMEANAAQTAAGIAGALDGAAGRAANRSRYGTGY